MGKRVQYFLSTTSPNAVFVLIFSKSLNFDAALNAQSLFGTC